MQEFEDVDSAEIRILVTALVDKLLVVVVDRLLMVADASGSSSGRNCPLMATAFVALLFE